MKKRKVILLLAVVTTTLLLVGCGEKETVSDNNTVTVTETNATEVETSSTSTEEPTSILEQSETSADEFEFYIIDYLTDAEVTETVYSVSEEGRPCVTVTHADGTTQRHELYEEQGEILWFAVVKGENEGEWGGNYNIPSSEEIETAPTTETLTSTEEPTPEPTEESTEEPAHEHSYSVTVIKEATCTGKIVYGGLSEAEASGEKLYSCSCGHSYTETISPIYCESDGNFVTIREATCGMEGEIADHCKHCGREMVCQATPMIPHVPTIRVNVPEDGKWFIPCEYCGTTIEWGYY